MAEQYNGFLRASKWPNGNFVRVKQMRVLSHASSVQAAADAPPAGP